MRLCPLANGFDLWWNGFDLHDRLGANDGENVAAGLFAAAAQFANKTAQRGAGKGIFCISPSHGR